MDVDMAMQPSSADLLLSLAAARKPSARSRLLDSLASAAGSDTASRHFLFDVFLCFTMDPFPYVRRSALDGLAATVCSELPELGRCYRRALELFVDADEVVRAAAVRVVGQYGQVLATSMGEEEKQDQLDEVFVRLCSMARDMNAEVRIEAFLALGKIQPISDDVLLQGLSKKVLGTKTERKVLTKFTSMEIVSLVASAAGAFIHGLEDELSEVRKAACASLGRLAVFSSQFADGAINLLMDLLNDDNSLVRLQTLDTMFHMVSYDQLKVEEAHMHMFISVLMDVDARVRHAAQKLLQVIRLQSMEIFKSSIEGLLKNLELYPQDENEIVSAIYFMGKNNNSHSAAFLREYAPQIKPSCKGDLILDKPQAKAALLLCLSMPTLADTCSSIIPPRAFVYAVPLLGKLPASVKDAIHLDPLSIHFSQFHVSDPCPGKLHDTLLNESLMSTHTVHTRHIFSCQKDEMISCMKLIFGEVVKTWLFLKSNHSVEALKCLRDCTQELSMVREPSTDLIGALEFIFEYSKAMKLFAKISEHMEPKQLHFKGLGALNYLLEKLEKCLLRLRYSFLGFTREVEIHVLELMLFSCALKLKAGRYHNPPVKNLQAILSHLECICEEEKVDCSNFAKVIKQLFHEENLSLSCQIRFSKLIDLISCESLMLSPNLRHMKVELNVSQNYSENPLPFITGLPVGITFNITLFNVIFTRRLWIQMKVGKLVEYSFLDLELFEGSDEERNCTLDIPFYGSPDVSFFSLFASVGMECPMEEVDFHGKGQGGPMSNLAILSKKREIYFVNVKKKHSLSWE